MSRVMTKMQSLDRLRTLIYRAGGTMHIQDILNEFPGRDRATVYRWLEELGAQTDQQGNHTLKPSAEEIDFARAVLDVC